MKPLKNASSHCHAGHQGASALSRPPLKGQSWSSSSLPGHSEVPVTTPSSLRPHSLKQQAWYRVPYMSGAGREACVIQAQPLVDTQLYDRTSESHVLATPGRPLQFPVRAYVAIFSNLQHLGLHVERNIFWVLAL